MQKRVNTSTDCVIIRIVTENMANSSRGLLKAKAITIVTMYRLEMLYSQYHGSVLEITGGHWPFSDQFQHLADQNPFWLAKLTVYIQWDSNQ